MVNLGLDSKCPSSNPQNALKYVPGSFILNAF